MSQVSAAQTIEALRSQVRDATIEAYVAQERLDAAKERLRSLRMAISGIELGQRSQEELALPAQEVAAA
jgi:hypothetical protein